VLHKSIENFVGNTVTREGNNRVIVQGDFLGDLCRVVPVCRDCGRIDQLERFCSHLPDQLTSHVQGAFPVVENGFYDTIKDLHASALRGSERVW